MSEWRYDGVGMRLEVADCVHVMVYDLDTPDRWVCQVTALSGELVAHIVEDEGVYASMEAAQIAGLEVAIMLAKQIESKATAELRKLKPDAEEVPPVVRHLSADQTVGHEELQRATFARAVKTPEKP